MHKCATGFLLNMSLNKVLGQMATVNKKHWIKEAYVTLFLAPVPFPSHQIPIFFL